MKLMRVFYLVIKIFVFTSLVKNSSVIALGVWYLGNNPIVKSCEHIYHDHEVRSHP